MNQQVALIAFQAVVLVFAFCIHECAHAWTAWRLGDPTAKMLGRVTLNPAKHLDPLGSVILPLIAVFYNLPLIGWAKPTPVTARNFKNYRRDDILLYFGILINLALFVFNLIPIPPLDGSHVLRHYLPTRALAVYDRMGMFSLILFFLVGGRVLGYLLAPLQTAFDSLLFSL